MFVLCLFLAVAFAAVELLNYNPVADPKAIVVNGNARFTVLTDQLIRMEYSSSGSFEDRATLAVVNRLLPVPAFTSNINGGVLTIQTSYIALSYAVGQPFSAASLSVKGTNSDSTFSHWLYGMVNNDYRNLLGTIRSLDELNVISLNCTENANVIVHDESLHCEWGLISRDGWALINEKGVPTLDSSYWWNGNSVDTEDLYLFAHGLNYKQAIYDYQLIGGKVIMVPKQFSGIMWSRWYDLADQDVKKVVNDYKSRSIPLDIFILDMDWHLKNDWTGYTFDGHLFPIPSQTMAWLHNQGLLTSGNLHDADGVGSFEKMYAQFATAVGIDPSSGKTVPFNLINQSWAYALEDIVLQDLEKQGMDFWWIDWQQGGTGGGCQGQKQNPTIWTNHLRATDRNRRGDTRRAAVLARFGGLGNHRYQVGFSGDVASLSWSNLAFQPYYSWTASNVLYGMWSHDLVGPYDDHELHTRWIQWGAVSGVFRTHDRGMAVGDCADTNTCAIVEIWKVPTNYFEANRKALQMRHKLLPYIYTLHRVAFDTGLSVMRPMYYNFPTFDNAYLGDSAGNYAQYMLGDDLMIAPVVTQADAKTNMAQKTIWVPPGNWVEIDSGVLYSGSASGTSKLSKQYDLSEIPVFARGGAVIPTIPMVEGDTIGVASRQYSTLVFDIFPGATSGSGKVYEDDGQSTNYLDGNSFAWTTASYTRASSGGTDTLTVTISSAGTYSGFPASRNYWVRLVNSIPPNTVTANGATINYALYPSANTWSYEANEVVTTIRVNGVSTSAALTIVVKSDTIQDSDYSGVKGSIQHAIMAKANLDPSWAEPGSQNPGPAHTSDLASVGVNLTDYVSTSRTAFKNLIAQIPNMLAAAITEIGGQPSLTGALLQLYGEERTDSILCGTQNCINSNSNYDQMRIEGYQALQGDQNVIPWNDWWNADLLDNWCTTATSSPGSGYSAASFSNGYVYSKQVAGTIPLQLWYSAARQDHLAVASAEGVQWAKDNGYTAINDSSNPLGWVFQDQPSYNARRLGTTAAQLEYSFALLNNAVVPLSS